ncbi:hypothetical protein [Thermosulfurimonas sp. F29]|uniref:hypothetical protein n=1 Tax=Thermosulfurimonas sp. F29 TaxID=2867247 RepID=UPI001C83BEAC|nr:hypothetical protein [Thermosulfurimonas sp. F29]MBX6422497.1 hypothetical protein [Thermosulfurimonas sp. F29]
MGEPEAYLILKNRSFSMRWTFEPLKVGLRAQDIQTGLQDVDLGALAAETKNVRLIGMAERLAIHIRGSDVISDYKRLEYIASQFGIDSLVLPNVLNVLQELEWARIEKIGTQIKKIEESVPYFSDIYSLAGEYFKNIPHSEVEEATIKICDTLAISPLPEEKIKEELGEDKLYEMVLSIGKSGGLIQEYQSRETGEKVLYSPQYWIENPEKIAELYKLIRTFGAENIHKVLQMIKEYQGFPINISISVNQELNDERKIIIEAIKRGIILAPKVRSFKGEKFFGFIPSIGISLEEKIIFEKAMAILACIRYGQHFGSITKIKYPEAIINKLLEPPHKIGSHTEIKQQYGILVSRGIGKIYRDRFHKDRYYFELIDTEENIKAVKLAKDLLKIGEKIEEKGLSEEIRKILFYPGSYEEALRTLPKMKRTPKISSMVQEEIDSIICNVMDILRT